LLERFDSLQRGHPVLGFPIAIVKKFGDDKAGYLAALIAYYAFFALFPLLLLLVTALGFFLGRNSGFQKKVLSSVLTQFPIIGQQISGNIHSIKGSGIALGIGIGGLLFAGMGLIHALQHAMDEVWDVPITERANFWASTARGVIILLAVGVGLIAATLAAGLGTGVRGGWSLPVRTAGIAASLCLDFVLFMVAFKALTVARLSWKNVLPGACFATVAWGILQFAGTYYVSRQLTKATPTYGFFAIVIGLLSWLYLGAQLTILAAEINVVKARRLWPRSLDRKHRLPGTEKRALAEQAEQEKRHPTEAIDVNFRNQPAHGAGTPPRP
jgi:YihY family inner membrane protein